MEIRADAESAGDREGLRIKCQREFVLKARIAKAESEGGEGAGRVKGIVSGGAAIGSVEDEMKRK